jgi:hypothetical protein
MSALQELSKAMGPGPASHPKGYLERVPGKQNWVDRAGGLPRYIERIASHVHDKGKSIGHSIAIAVNAAKKMCATGDLNWSGKQSVNSGSRAAACKAVAEWEAKKAAARVSKGIRGRKLTDDEFIGMFWDTPIHKGCDCEKDKKRKKKKASALSELAKREFSTEKRKELKQQGKTDSHGGFPLEKPVDVKNAVRAIGRAKNPEMEKRRIKAAAKKFNCEHYIPDGWKSGEVKKYDPDQPRDRMGRWTDLPGVSPYSKIKAAKTKGGKTGVFVDGYRAPIEEFDKEDDALKRVGDEIRRDRGAKKTAAKKTAAKKTPAKKAPAKKTAAQKAAASSRVASKVPARGERSPRGTSRSMSSKEDLTKPYKGTAKGRQTKEQRDLKRQKEQRLADAKKKVAAKKTPAKKATKKAPAPDRSKQRAREVMDAVTRDQNAELGRMLGIDRRKKRRPSEVKRTVSRHRIQDAHESERQNRGKKLPNGSKVGDDIFITNVSNKNYKNRSAKIMGYENGMYQVRAYNQGPRAHGQMESKVINLRESQISTSRPAEDTTMMELQSKHLKAGQAVTFKYGGMTISGKITQVRGSGMVNISGSDGVRYRINHENLVDFPGKQSYEYFKGIRKSLTITDDEADRLEAELNFDGVPDPDSPDFFEFDVSGSIEKKDDDKRLVFGWASIAKDKDGNVIVDKQGDVLEDIDQMEKVAYDFVLHSRDGGEMHVRKGVSTLVESVVFTPEKCEALGIPENTVPTGWWVGFKVHDDNVWKGVKSKKYKQFSVHGSGMRKALN